MELKPTGLFEKYSCSLEIYNEEHTYELAGWFPIEYVSYSEQTDYFKVICKTTHNGLYWKNKDSLHHDDKTQDDIWVLGKLDIDDDQKFLILKKYFEAY